MESIPTNDDDNNFTFKLLDKIKNENTKYVIWNNKINISSDKKKYKKIRNKLKLL